MSRDVRFDCSSFNLEGAFCLTDLPMPDSICVPEVQLSDNPFIGLTVSAFKAGFRVSDTDD